MSRVLLTAARTLGCLELARQLHGAGHEVLVAESFPDHLCGASRAVRLACLVPPLRQEPEAWVDAIAGIVTSEGIDLLVPTCEEVLYLAWARDRLGGRCRLLAGDYDALLWLHDKWRFTHLARAAGLEVPATTLLTDRKGLEAVLTAGSGPSLVLKPVYSRFAARTVIRPRDLRDAEEVHPTPAEPWIAQEFVAGREICTYSVAHGGILTAHVAYPLDLALDGQGPTVAYEPMVHGPVLAAARRLAGVLGFTGQFGLDFIEAPDCRLVVLECNPRTTGGVHCFDGTPAFPAALLEGSETLVEPADSRPRMIAGAMFLGLPRWMRSVRDLSAWARLVRSSRPIVFRRDDPAPAFRQGRLVAHFNRLALREGLGRREARTWDLAFDGAAARLRPASGSLRLASGERVILGAGEDRAGGG